MNEGIHTLHSVQRRRTTTEKSALDTVQGLLELPTLPTDMRRLDKHSNTIGRDSRVIVSVYFRLTEEGKTYSMCEANGTSCRDERISFFPSIILLK